MSLYDRAEEGMTRLEGLISDLPVIREYRAKELRRDADYRLRQKIADQLKTYRRRITSLQRDLVSAGRLRELPEIERAVGRLQLLIDRIRTASYGYAPFYDAQEIREAELDKLIAFDEAIAKQLPLIDKSVRALAEAVNEAGAFKKALDALMEALNQLNARYEQRENMISYLAGGGESAPDTALDSDTSAA